MCLSCEFGNSGATIPTLRLMLWSPEGHRQRSPAAVAFCNVNTSSGDPQIEHHCIHFQLTFHVSNTENGKHREQRGFRSNQRTISRVFFFFFFKVTTEQINSSADLVKSTKCKSLLCFQGSSHPPSLPAYLVHSRIHTMLFHMSVCKLLCSICPTCSPLCYVWAFSRYSRHRPPTVNIGAGDSSVWVCVCKCLPTYTPLGVLVGITGG